DAANGFAKHATKYGKRCLCGISFRHLVRAMPQSHMRNFVRHHAGKLRLVAGIVENSAIDVKKAARQSKCVDCRIVYNLELVRVPCSRCSRSKSPSKRRYVRTHLAVVDDLEFLFGIM